MTFWKKKEVQTPAKNIQEFRHETNLLRPLIGLGVLLVLAVLAYGFFVAPCSFNFEGKITGFMEMENPVVSGSELRITSIEGKVSGTAPCVAVLSMGFNAKATTPPPQTPIRSVPRSSLSGGM